MSDLDVITLSVAGLILALSLVALLRVLFRREPSPPRWLRFRVGMFLERDPRDEPDPPPVAPEDAPTKVNWPAA